MVGSAAATPTTRLIHGFRESSRRSSRSESVASVAAVTCSTTARMLGLDLLGSVVREQQSGIAVASDGGVTVAVLFPIEAAGGRGVLVQRLQCGHRAGVDDDRLRAEATLHLDDSCCLRLVEAVLGHGAPR